MAVKNILEKIGGLFRNINVKNTAENIADNVRKTGSKAKDAVSGAIDNVRKTGSTPKAPKTKTPKSRQLGSNSVIGSGIVDKIPNQSARGFTSIAVNAGIGAVGGGVIGAAVAENDERTDRSKGFVAGALIGAGTMAAGTAFMNRHDLQIARGLAKNGMDGNKGVAQKAAEAAAETTTVKAPKKRALQTPVLEQQPEPLLLTGPTAEASAPESVINMSGPTVKSETPIIMPDRVAQSQRRQQMHDRANWTQTKNKVRSASPQQVKDALDRKRIIDVKNNPGATYEDIDGQLTFTATWNPEALGAQDVIPQNEVAAAVSGSSDDQIPGQMNFFPLLNQQQNASNINRANTYQSHVMHKKNIPVNMNKMSRYVNSRG